MDGIKMWKGIPNRFDLVMCCQLTEHLSDPVGLFQKLTSLGNLVYIEVPAKGPTLQDGIPKIHEHINFFTLKSLEMMTGGKFNIKEIDFGYEMTKIIYGLI